MLLGQPTIAEQRKPFSYHDEATFECLRRLRAREKRFIVTAVCAAHTASAASVAAAAAAVVVAVVAACPLFQVLPALDSVIVCLVHQPLGAQNSYGAIVQDLPRVGISVFPCSINVRIPIYLTSRRCHRVRREHAKITDWKCCGIEKSTDWNRNGLSQNGY